MSALGTGYGDLEGESAVLTVDNQVVGIGEGAAPSEGATWSTGLEQTQRRRLRQFNRRARVVQLGRVSLRPDWVLPLPLRLLPGWSPPGCCCVGAGPPSSSAAGPAMGRPCRWPRRLRPG